MIRASTIRITHNTIDDLLISKYVFHSCLLQIIPQVIMSSDDTTKRTGSCQCGGFRYEYSGKPTAFYNCHCKICRKASGGTFLGIFAVPVSNMIFLAKETLASYESTKGVNRYFCTRCGCSTYCTVDENDFYMTAGTLDQEPGIGLQAEIFVTYKAPWHRLCGDVPSSGEDELVA